MARHLGFRLIPALLVLFSAGVADAGDSLADYTEASQKMARLINDADRTNNIKQLQSKEADRLVRVLSDEKRFLKSDPYSADQVGEIIQLCALSNRAVMSLALFDLKGSIDPKEDRKKIAVKVAALVTKNTQTFSRQLAQLQPFAIRCMAKEIHPLSEFMTSLPPEKLTPVRRKGLQQARTGVAQMFVGVVKNVGDTNYDETYRLAIVQALAESAPELISSLPLSMRARIKSVVGPVDTSTPHKFEAYLKRIDKALDNKSCEGLCTI